MKSIMIGLSHTRKSGFIEKKTKKKRLSTKIGYGHHCAACSHTASLPFYIPSSSIIVQL